MTEFFRFPQTPHLAWLAEGGTPRDDKQLSLEEVASILSAEVVVEEKLDGANLGFSLHPDGIIQAQNRGTYLQEPYDGQFQRLERWLAVHGDRIFDALTEDLIFFGEWCAAKHSLDYPCLPDWWLMFDVYDRKQQKFWSTRRRNELAAQIGVSTVPCLMKAQLTLEDLKEYVANGKSRYRDGALEGVVVRHEDADWLLARGKLVRADFTQAIEGHWRSRAIEWNRVQF